jgi:hypothetical protein
MWAPSFDIVSGARGGLLRVALLALFCASLVALGAWAGHSLGRAPMLVELADLRTVQAETAKLQALAAARTLSDAQVRSDALTVRLAGKQEQIFNLQRAAHASINQTTFNRLCLSADAVRVLNGTDGAAGTDVPQTGGSAAAAGGAFATDADVGHWAVDARAAHTECRARLDALIDWHSPQTETTTGPQALHTP